MNSNSKIHTDELTVFFVAFFKNNKCIWNKMWMSIELRRQYQLLLVNIFQWESIFQKANWNRKNFTTSSMFCVFTFFPQPSPKKANLLLPAIRLTAARSCGTVRSFSVTITTPRKNWQKSTINIYMKEVSKCYYLQIIYLNVSFCNMKFFRIFSILKSKIDCFINTTKIYCENKIYALN